VNSMDRLYFGSHCFYRVKNLSPAVFYGVVFDSGLKSVTTGLGLSVCSIFLFELLTHPSIFSNSVFVGFSVRSFL
jgi:hypothetical protein